MKFLLLVFSFVISFTGIAYAQEDWTKIKPRPSSLADCPTKVLGKKTVEGYYEGTAIGDLVHFIMTLKDGTEFELLGDEEKIYKELGEKEYTPEAKIKKRGKLVSVTYTIELGFMPDSFESAEEDPKKIMGSCQVLKVYESGRVIGK